MTITYQTKSFEKRHKLEVLRRKILENKVPATARVKYIFTMFSGILSRMVET